MNTTTKDVSQVARPLAPEDVEPDQYVFVFHVLEEFLPVSCLTDGSWKEPAPLRLLFLPESGVAPLRVVEVCVPFVLVEQVDGTHRTLDMRRYRLAKVSERFGHRAFKRLRRRPGAKQA